MENTYFKIIKSEDCGEGAHEIDVQLKKTLFYKGHFPTQPVLPAFVIVMMAAFCLKSLGNFFLNGYEIKASKFKKIIDPKKSVNFKIQKINNTKIQIDVFQDQNSCANLFFLQDH